MGVVGAYWELLPLKEGTKDVIETQVDGGVGAVNKDLRLIRVHQAMVTQGVVDDVGAAQSLSVVLVKLFGESMS